jgi:hypothetical protein
VTADSADAVSAARDVHVSNDAHVEALRRWDVEDVIPDAMYAHVTSSADFPNAVRALSRNMLAAAARDRAFDGIAKDGGRYVATEWALYLDATGGLTLPRLKEICAASGILSPGRARAVLLFLRYLRYVDLTREQTGDGPALYRPTRSLIDAWRLMTRQRMTASRLLEPALDLVIDQLEEPKVLEAIFRHQGSGMFLVASRVDKNNPFLDIFLHRHAGVQMLHTIVVSADPDDEFPPLKPVPITIATIARQLNVSRTHVKRMLSAAERAGLLSGVDDGALVLKEPMRFAMRYVLATTLMANIIVASKVVRERPELFRARPALAAAG